MSSDNPVDNERIRIPPDLISILRNYTKAVIRSQPTDFLKWSALYFRALSNNQIPDVEKRLLFFGPSAGGISQAILRLLYLKFKTKDSVLVRDLKSQWNDLALDSTLLCELLRRTDAPEGEDSEVVWIKILALATASSSVNLEDTMKNFCEIAGDTSCEHRMSYHMFKEVYTFLAELDEVPSLQIESVLVFFNDRANKQDGTVIASNFMDPDCPHL